MTTTKTTGKGEVRVPWGKIGEQLEATLAAHGVTDESIRATVQAHNARMAAGLPRRVVGGAEMYRDHGAREDMDRAGFAGERTYSQPAARTTTGLSEKQVKLVDALLSEKVHEYTEAEVNEAKADWRKGRPMIDALIKAPRRPWQAPVAEIAPAPAVTPERTRLNFAEIADGNYAVREDGVVKFYRVSTKGQWKNVQVRASDQLWPVRGKGGIAILHRIVEAGLAESRMLFVTELERCCKCGRSLTDEESRANARQNGGYGPDCAGN